MRPKIVSSLPGDSSSQAELQDFTNRRLFSRGYKLTTGTGIQTFDQIKFPGTARLFCGLTLIDTSGDATNRFTLSINQEKVIDGSSWAEYTKTSLLRTVAGQVIGSSFNGMFYWIPRQLSGNDAVEVTYDATTAGILLPTFWFRTLPVNN